MEEKLKFYIDGKWVDPVSPKTLEVINPANEEPFAKISMGSKADVDKAVAAARKAFDTFSQTSREERVALLEKIVAVYQKRYGDIVKAISMEMGAPLSLSQNAQAAIGMGHLQQGIKILKEYEFEQVKGSYAIRREPIGVVGMITPWNWPINQIACKVVPALAAGCTMILKPSEIAPMNAILWAEVMDEA
ncbi:MAG TPA: aldehyde dehydrogenase family protein, partial [Rhizomicrobium sp.]